MDVFLYWYSVGLFMLYFVIFEITSLDIYFSVDVNI